MSKRIRRISFFAGPGAGKSTIAAWLFAQMKMDGMNVEHVQEYIKGWAFIGRCPAKFDQVYIFGKQVHREDVVLRTGSDFLVTESPIFLGTCYAVKNKTPGWKHLVALADEFERHYPSLNIYLNRNGMKYNKHGRFQTHKQAMAMDRFVKKTLRARGVKFVEVDYKDLEGVKRLVYEGIGKGKLLPRPETKKEKARSKKLYAEMARKYYAKLYA